MRDVSDSTNVAQLAGEWQHGTEWAKVVFPKRNGDGVQWYGHVTRNVSAAVTMIAG